MNFFKPFFGLSVAFVFLSFACGTSGNTTVLPRVSDACNVSINSFNYYTGNTIMIYMDSVNRLGKLTPGLRALYPAARKAWNDGLDQIRTSYAYDWQGVDLRPIPAAVYTSRNLDGLEDYQKFFFLLTEALHGEYPSGPDTQSKNGWQENADISKKLLALTRILKQNCHSSKAEDVRKLLAPEGLPQNIEDCLNRK